MPRVADLGRALLAGAVALAVNFALLLGADALGIVTARGGFQRLVKIWLGPLLTDAGIYRTWTTAGLPDPATATFMIGFKIAVGLGFALLYAVIEPFLPGRPIVKGLIYAALVWVINAALVLPLLGEGFAGTRSLTPLGIGTFAFAHTAFFVVLALLYRPQRSLLLTR